MMGILRLWGKTSVLLAVVLGGSVDAWGKVIYVDANTPGVGDGTNWRNAYKFLQDALADASLAEKPVEIRVARGVYTPDCDSALPNGSGDKSATFSLLNGVVIYGGFPPGGGTWNHRDPNDPNNQTVLSGDLNGDDAPVVDPRDLSVDPTRLENSHHVVTATNCDITAMLDGFAIEAGASGIFDGGGMYNTDNSHPKIANCTFRGNSAWRGGGMYNLDDSHPTLINCTFTRNYAESGGGGMDNYQYSSPTLTNCEFTQNVGGDGGGMCNWKYSSPTLANCVFNENSADHRGGGMDNANNCNPNLTNCMFNDNSAPYGGGMTNADNSYPRLITCAFTGNHADQAGGAMQNLASYPTLINCTVTANSAQDGGGMANLTTIAILFSCAFADNRASNDGGAIWGTLFAQNEATNCTFTRNHAGEDGGAICYGGTGTLINCSFTSNQAGNHGGALYNLNSRRVTMSNCILWNNRDSTGIGASSQIHRYAIVTYSNVQGGWDGLGNIDADPCFATVADPNNLHLSGDSPCIDAASNAEVPPDTADIDNDANTTEPIPFDINGFPRFIDDLCTGDTGFGEPPLVDMGAHEFLSSDINADGIANFSDFCLLAVHWMEAGCGPCAGADVTCDGNVTYDDLRESVAYWLTGGEP